MAYVIAHWSILICHLETYFSTLAPACAHWASWSLAPPDSPTAPTIFPAEISGTPPSTGTAPSNLKSRSPAPPPATPSWNTLVGRLKSAAERALSWATLTLPIWVPSIFSNRQDFRQCRRPLQPYSNCSSLLQPRRRQQPSSH